MCDYTQNSGQTTNYSHSGQIATRRRVVSCLAAGGVAAIAGCLGNDENEAVHEPIALDGTKQCDACGMIVEDGFGPNGQVFFDNDYPAERDGPAWYDSVREMFVDQFTQENRHEPLATFVTDYSAVEYTIDETDGARYISGHISKESFVAADDAVYVIESDIEGVMGADLLPFGNPTEGESFTEAHGGRVLEYDEITADVVNAI